jgi:hypothetical protein
MMKHPYLVAAVLMAACAGTASAQSLKPGLWEIATQMQGTGPGGDAMAEAQKQMQSMPPEQRKMMEAMMAKQGVQMGIKPGGGMTIKICMTKEMAERNEVARQEGDCTHTNSQRSGGTMKFSFVCKKPPSSGEGQVTFTSPEAYNTKMAITSTHQGAPTKTEMQSSGRWLSADCGSVKPLPMPAK